MTAATPPSHYEVLGVARDASADEIKAAWRRLSSENHPDKNPGDPQAQQRMQAINRAYEVLADPERRAAYDENDGVDVEQRTLEADAIEALADLFQFALNKQADNVVLFTHTEITLRVEEARMQIDSANTQITILQARRVTVRTKRPEVPNIVHSLIDSRVKALQGTIRGNERMIKVAGEAQRMLGEYEYCAPPPPGAFAAREALLEYRSFARMLGQRGVQR